MFIPKLFYAILRLLIDLTQGVANGDEVHFLFDTGDDHGDFSLIRKSRPKNLPFSVNVVKLWVIFAANGMQGEDWKSMKGQSRGNFQWYHLGDEDRAMIDEPFRKEADFWDSLGLDEPRPLPPPEETRKKNLGRKDQMGPPDEGFVYVDLATDGE